MQNQSHRSAGPDTSNIVSLCFFSSQRLLSILSFTSVGMPNQAVNSQAGTHSGWRPLATFSSSESEFSKQRHSQFSDVSETSSNSESCRDSTSLAPGSYLGFLFIADPYELAAVPSTPHQRCKSPCPQDSGSQPSVS